MTLLVSILVPMRNAEAFVGRTLKSLVDQTVPDGAHVEIVVIDDGSSDGSRGVVDAMPGQSGKRCSVRVVEGPRAGISAAMNAGLAAARGELVCRCDADDLYPPGRLFWQIGWLGDHQDFSAVCGSFSTINARGRAIADLDCGGAAQEITEELRAGVTRTHFCTFLVRTDALRAAGGFREWFVTAEDIDVQLRLGEACRVGYEPVSSYLYRLHDASITHRQPDERRAFYEASARLFAGQRRRTGADDLQAGHPPVPPAGASAPRSTSHQVQQVLIGTSWKLHKSGHKGRAIATGLRACFVRPASIAAWSSFAKLVVKRAG